MSPELQWGCGSTAAHRTNPNLAFWKMLKIGNDHFEATHLEPKVDVCNRRYVFNAQPPRNWPFPLVFNPAGKCPASKIARRALEKQRTDEVEYAQLKTTCQPPQSTADWTAE
jgi:murein L,D-transpeptidase YafK